MSFTYDAAEWSAIDSMIPTPFSLTQRERIRSWLEETAAWDYKLAVASDERNERERQLRAELETYAKEARRFLRAYKRYKRALINWAETQPEALDQMADDLGIVEGEGEFAHSDERDMFEFQIEIYCHADLISKPADMPSPAAKPFRRNLVARALHIARRVGINVPAGGGAVDGPAARFVRVVCNPILIDTEKFDEFSDAIRKEIASAFKLLPKVEN